MSGAVTLNRDVTGLLVRARMSLGMSQAELGEHLGVSKRTMGRYEARRSSLGLIAAVALARLVFPRDAGIASELAAAASETLVSLGLVAPPPAVTPAPPTPALPLHLVVDSVVCAAADALGAAPGAVRAALHAAFKRTRELRLSLEDVEKVLAPAAQASHTPGASVKTSAPPTPAHRS